jgi:hypothetical protein
MAQREHSKTIGHHRRDRCPIGRRRDVDQQLDCANLVLTLYVKNRAFGISASISATFPRHVFSLPPFIQQADAVSTPGGNRYFPAEFHARQRWSVRRSTRWHHVVRDERKPL